MHFILFYLISAQERIRALDLRKEEQNRLLMNAEEWAVARNRWCAKCRLCELSINGWHNCKGGDDPSVREHGATFTFSCLPRSTICMVRKM